MTAQIIVLRSARSFVKMNSKKEAMRYQRNTFYSWYLNQLISCSVFSKQTSKSLYRMEKLFCLNVFT